MLPTAQAFDATWGEQALLRYHYKRLLSLTTYLTDRLLCLLIAQEFLNNYFRFYPKALQLLPCGCNYQYTATRRSVRCPGQPVHIAHAWSSGMGKGQARSPCPTY